MGKGKYRVYEVVNFDTAELVIGLAPDDLAPDFLTRAATRPGWTDKHRVTFRIIEDALALDHAARFALNYSESAALKPFAVFLGPDLTETVLS